MNINDVKRAKALSASLAGLIPSVKKQKVKKATTGSSYKYKSLGGKQAPWLSSKAVPSPYSKTLSQRIQNLGAPRPEKVIEKPVYYGKPGERGQKGDKGDAGRDGEDGATPVKGIHYFTDQEVNSLKQEIIDTVKGHIPAAQEPLRVDLEFVKHIVELMHQLPEQDKLEVSKGIRNAQSFIFNKTKYQTSELMHGGGSSSSGGGISIETPTGTVNAVNAVFTPSKEPLFVIADGITSFAGAGYTWNGTTITMDIPPSQYIRDAISS